MALRLPKDTEERLNALARQKGRTKTFYVHEAIINYREDCEDFYLAQDRLKSVGKTVPLEDLTMEEFAVAKDTREGKYK